MILTFDKVNFINEMMRFLFASIDKLIYTLIGWIMEGIFNLSGLATNFELARSIYNRIYVVLALFMVFKLTLSFLQYIANPESMADKERGVGKLISRVVIMLGLLLLFPILFFENLIEVNGDKQTLLEATQTGVIKTLPKIILGIDDAASGDASQGTIAANAANNGQYMATEMLKAFYYPIGCDNDVEDGETSCESDQIKNLDEFESTVLVENGEKYSYKYMWPLTTVSGIALAVILIGIAIDVAIRVFKLLLLQLIAPVPIMSYIDPKSSKDGAFGSWIKSFSSTFLDIFIKLGTVYLLLLLFSEAFQSGGLFAEDHGIANVEGFTARNFVKVFLVIGLFKFAKDAPKFIKDALGMKDSGNGSMFGGLSTLGAAVGTIGGAAAGFVGGAAGGVAAAKAAGQKNSMAALKGLGGGLAGLGRGGMQGAKGAGKGNLIKGMSGAIAAQNAVTQRKLAAAAGGSTFMGRMGAGIDEFLGRTNKDDLALEDAKNLNSAAKNIKTIRDTAESKGYLNRSLAIGNVKGHVFAAGEHTGFKEAFEKAQREGSNHVAFSSGGATSIVDMQTASGIYSDLSDAVADKYLDGYKLGSNATIDSAFQEYRVSMDAVSDSSLEPLDFESAVKKTYSKDLVKKGAEKAASVDPSRSRAYKANKEARKKSK